MCHATVLKWESGRPPEGGNGPELVLLVAPAACGPVRPVQKGSRGSRERLMHGVDQPKYAGVFRCLQGAGNQTIAERLTIYIRKSSVTYFCKYVF